MKFSKMHSLGNDFLVFYDKSPPDAQFYRHVRDFSDRHTGVGFDQLLWITPGTSPGTFRFHIFNADGSSAKQCLNGARCVARYLCEQGVWPQKQLTLDCGSGPIAVTIESFDKICLKFNNIHCEIKPAFEFKSNHYHEVLLGNAHVITYVRDLSKIEVATLGGQLQKRYPDGVNVGFVQILSENHIAIKTYERGTGETLACGSNALAAALLSIQLGRICSPVTISFALGECVVSFDAKTQTCELIGPASQVFVGEL